MVAVLWPNLISAVAGNSPNPRIKAAASSAARAADNAGRQTEKDTRVAIFTAAFSATRAAALVADSAALSAALSALLAEGDTTAAAWEAIRWDCLTLEAGEDPCRTPLWLAGNPLATLWAETREMALAQGPKWRFWVDWYDKSLRGEPRDWDLLTRIALIDPKDWAQGADHVNARIAAIVRDHKPKPPKITDVERSHIDMVLSVREPSRQSADFLRVQFEKMEDAYRKAVGSPNETPEELEPIVVLARTFGEISSLLRGALHKGSLIAELQTRISVPEAPNALLLRVANWPRAAFMRDIFVASLGSALGGAAVMILASHGFLGGAAVAKGIAPLYNLIAPVAPAPDALAPVIDLSPSIPRP